MFPFVLLNSYTRNLTIKNLGYNFVNKIKMGWATRYCMSLKYLSNFADNFQVKLHQFFLSFPFFILYIFIYGHHIKGNEHFLQMCNRPSIKISLISFSWRSYCLKFTAKSDCNRFWNEFVVLYYFIRSNKKL